MLPEYQYEDLYYATVKPLLYSCIMCVVSNDLNLLYFKQYLHKDQTQVLEHFEPPSVPNINFECTDNDALACETSIFAPLATKYT